MSKKDSFMLFLWSVYSTILGYVGTTLEGEETFFEKFFISVLVANIFLFLYGLLMLLLNLCAEKCFKFRFKIPPPKRFKEKVTPIYELYVFRDEWSVTKYELQWSNEHEYANWFIPFSSLFETYCYINVGEYCFNYDLEGITNTGLLWEEKHKEDSIEMLAKKTEKERKEDKINELNKTFLKNYE